MKRKKQNRKGRPLCNPEDYTPIVPADLIGPARAIAERLLAHADKIKTLMLHGTWGNGKTSILKMIARALAPHGRDLDVESINGRNLTIDVVRDWQRYACYGSLFGGWKVKLINEVDLTPLAAQELMLTFLDELPPRLAVLSSSNASLETLSDRFVTRFSPLQVGNPTDDEITRWLVDRWHIPRTVASFIAIGAGGNVRDALKRASGYLIHGDIANVQRPKRIVSMIDPAKSESARKAWETMRAKQNGKAAA